MVAEISEVSIECDNYGDLKVSLQRIGGSDQLKVEVNDLIINIDDRIALELLICLAEHYDYKLIDLEDVGV
jgi:hypothetical protein